MTGSAVSLRAGVLGDIADVLMGQSPVGSSYNRARIGAPLINGPTEFTDRHPVPKQWSTAPVRFCKAEDVLICVRGSSTGRMSIADQDYCIGRGVAAVRAKRGNDQNFVTYALSAVVSDLLKLQTGSTFPSIDSRVIKGGSLLVPSLREQEQIGEALFDADDLIASLERLIAKKQAIKQGMMQQLLTGRTRLPGFTAPWRETTWGDVAGTISSGSTPRRSRRDFWNGSIPWVTSTELKRGVIRRIPQTITEAGLLAANLTIWPRGTFLMAITGLEAAGTRGSCGILGTAAATNQSCMAILPSEYLDTSFLFFHYLLRGEELAFRYTQGTKQQSYTAGVVRTLPIWLPTDINEQRAIATALLDANAEIEALQTRHEKARAIKTGMMQQLLTCRTRMPVEAVS